MEVKGREIQIGVEARLHVEKRCSTESKVGAGGRYLGQFSCKTAGKAWKRPLQFSPSEGLRPVPANTIEMKRGPKISHETPST